LAGGSGILLYIALWLIIPSKKDKKSYGSDLIKQNANEMKEKAIEISEGLKNSKTQGNSRYIIGLIIIGVGIMFLFENLGIFPLFRFAKLWPLLIIAIGLLMLKNK
jgi:hypothetical protein